MFYQKYAYVSACITYAVQFISLICVHQKVLKRWNFPSPSSSSSSAYRTDGQVTFDLTLHRTANKSSCSAFMYSSQLFMEARHIESITRHLQPRSTNALNDAMYWVFRNWSLCSVNLFLLTRTVIPRFWRALRSKTPPPPSPFLRKAKIRDQWFSIWVFQFSSVSPS